MSNDRLLKEMERQDKYVEQLPEDFTFPLFNSKRALESQRKSGYRNSAAAAREIVDNAMEAGASRIDVVFDTPREKNRQANQRRSSVISVAFIDDGAGMSPKMARFALSWGGGTHFEDGDAEFIGKFGFGLPNASINQTRRVEVYSRRSADEPFYRAWLDLDEHTGEGNIQHVPEPIQAELPEFVREYLKREKWSLGRGTIVVWSKPDHLTYSSTQALKDHLLDDFGATYRYLLREVRLTVAGTLVEKVDPLFLDPAARYYRKPEEGGARLVDETALIVKYTVDPVTGERQLAKVDDPTELEDPAVRAAGTIHVRVASFPLGFVVGKERADQEPPTDEHAGARFEIRKSRRGMSFVRAGREIETVDIFPRRASDVASGLGDWPLLQSFAYHWGIEVKFTPSLDPVFGITNDKQSVRPIEDFWRLLAVEEFDALLKRQNLEQQKTRREARDRRKRAKLERSGDKPTPAEVAAQAADVAVGDRPAIPDHDIKDANLAFEKKAQEFAKERDRSIEEARETLESQQKFQPYKVEFIDDEHGAFYAPGWVGRQIVVRINRSHPFFSAHYGTLVQVEGGGLAQYAVDLLMIALAREELTTKNEETAEFYRAQREQRWSPFLASAVRKLSRDFSDSEEADESV